MCSKRILTNFAQNDKSIGEAYFLFEGKYHKTATYIVAHSGPLKLHGALLKFQLI